MKISTAMGAASVSLLLLGCGSASGTPGSAGSGGSGAGGTGGSGGSGGSTSEGGNGGSSCEIENDEAEGDLTIVVTNQRTTPVYYPAATNSCNRRLAIAFASVPDATNGTLGCRTLPLDCFGGEGEQLAPGASHSYTWSGLLAEDVPVPTGCDPNQGQGTFVCDRGVAPAAGEEGSVEAYLKGTCDSIYEYDYCEDPITVSGTFVHGDGAMIELLVQ
jgi:hypothetical protein